MCVYALTLVFADAMGFTQVDVKFSARGGQDSLGPKIQTIEVRALPIGDGVLYAC